MSYIFSSTEFLQSSEDVMGNWVTYPTIKATGFYTLFFPSDVISLS